MKYQYLFSFFLILGFSACTTIGDIEPATPIQAEPPPTNTVGFVAPASLTEEPQKDSTQMTQPTSSSGLESLIEKAREDLAQRLSISIYQIDLVEAMDVVWPDASLGCPQSGMVYTQVLTPGFILQLEALGQVYEYHTDMDDVVISCNSTFDEKSPVKDTDKSVDDGWPNQTKDDVIIKLTPTKRPGN